MSSIGKARVIKPGHKPDYLILFCFGFLVLFGLVMLSSASSNLGRASFNDTSYYLKHQLLYGVLPGLIGFFITSKFYYGKYRSRTLSVMLLLVTLVLLGLVFTPFGFSAKGATRWIHFGPVAFQPSELLKLTLVIYLASWLSHSNYRQKRFKEGALPLLLILGIVSGFLLLEHSTSPVVILLITSLVMYFVSGARLSYVAGIIGVGVLGLAMIVAITPYRAQRVLSYLHPEADPQASGYQVLQAKIAIGSGGLTGVGYGQSTVKFRLPEPMGDSIFAVIAEEFGFIGALLLIGIILFLVLRIFLLARASHDRFAQLLLVGFGSLIGIQSFVNVGAMTGVLPLTGTPLPFISYGGTALMVFMTMMGIVVNISKYN